MTDGSPNNDAARGAGRGSIASEAIDVVIPNFNWRFSGVTAVNRRMAPLLAKRCRVAWIGPHRPTQVPALRLGHLLRMHRLARAAPAAIWHARRNVEMIVGLVLRCLRFRFTLVFTSEAQRHHTWITRFLIARMDAIVATSEAAAGFLRVAATIIPHGIDTAVYHPPADRHAAFAATDLPGTYGIGAFGRVRAQKGTDVFVAAMCRLLPKYPQFTAVVIGRVTVEHHAFVEGLRRMVAEAGLEDRVRFLGELPVDEVPLWYQRITIYAFTSRVEGFGLTILEAMASGAALVAARAGAAEVVVEQGETGVLVPPGDVDALVAALEPLMQDPGLAADMGRRGRARVVSDFSIETEAERIAAFYARLAA